MMDNKKAKRLSKEDTKTKLLESINIDEVFRRGTRFGKISRNIIKTKNKGIINGACYQGQVFKRFKEKEKLTKLVSELGIRKILSFLKLMFSNCVKNAPNY